MGALRCTRGRQLLLKVLQSLSYSELAGRLKRRAKALRLKAGSSKASISYWGSGRKIPQYGNRRVLLEELSIPLDAWDEDVANDVVPTEVKAAIAA